MRKIGKVVSVDKDKVTLEVRRSSACGEKCGSCKGNCNDLLKIIEAENTIMATPGEMVSLEIEDNLVLKGAFLVYIFPLMMLITGIIVGKYIHEMIQLTFNQEIFSILVGLFLMGISYAIVKLIDKKVLSKKSFTGKIKRVNYK